jgi:nitrogenase molybdenum-iron protein NifN
MNKTASSYVSTTNACKLCKPLGACLAFRGIEGAVPFLHGSQGCATYMRRYIISHFREPMDIASSSLGEKHAIYGGGPNLKQGIRTVMNKYGARLVGIATTCLTETIGDDVGAIVKEFRREAQTDASADADKHPRLQTASAETPPGAGEELPLLVTVSTPSYSGTHMEGFHATVRAVVDQLAVAAAGTPSGAVEAGVTRSVGRAINLLPGFVSPADIRYLKEIMEDFAVPGTILPDISDTLDGPAQEDYLKIPAGGTPLAAIRGMGTACGTVEFGRVLGGQATAGRLLEERCAVPLHALGMPIGLRETDRLFEVLEDLSGHPVPAKHAAERGRLVDALVDTHKYVFNKRVLIYGDEDLVVGLAALVAEVGIRPVLCAAGGRSGHFQAAVDAVTADLLAEPPLVREGVDFYDIAEEAAGLALDLIIGHSKGYSLARRWGLPLIRVGFPIHDRVGGQRVLHLGYRGAQQLLDQMVNALLAKKQQESSVGYGYL